MPTTSLIEMYRTELRRFAWRIQYQHRSKRKHEVIDDETKQLFSTSDFTSKSNSNIYVEELLDILPSTNGKIILHRIYVDGKTELEIADELGISQQAVSKCKKKMLQILKLKINS